MFRSQIILISVLIMAILTTGFAVSSLSLFDGNQFSADAQDVEKSPVTVSGGHNSYNSITTTGDVIDSVNADERTNFDIDPMK